MVLRWFVWRKVVVIRFGVTRTKTSSATVCYIPITSTIEELIMPTIEEFGRYRHGIIDTATVIIVSDVCLYLSSIRTIY